MTYITESDLARYRGVTLEESKIRATLKASQREAQVSIFLSHSHKDKELVAGFARWLATLGTSIYIDWQDTTMPAITNIQTALAIKNQINSRDIFMVLATANALTSRWVPWEIGVADQLKGFGRIFIVPVVQTSGHYLGNEYLQLYQRIEIARGGALAYFEPGTKEGYTLADLLDKHAQR